MEYNPIFSDSKGISISYNAKSLMEMSGVSTEK